MVAQLYLGQHVHIHVVLKIIVNVLFKNQACTANEWDYGSKYWSEPSSSSIFCGCEQ